VYPQLVDRILTNKFYAGIVTNPWSGAEFAGKHEPAVSLLDFMTIQRVRKGRSLAYPVLLRSEHPDFPLRRTVRCDSCASSLTGSWSRGNGGKYAYYHCPSRRCVMYGKAVRKTLLEQKFQAKLDEITPKPSYLALIGAVVVDIAHGDQAATKDDSKRRAKHLAELTERLDRLIAMKERELLSDDEFRPRKRKLNDEITLAQITLAKPKEADDDIDGIVGSAMPFVASIPEQWFAMPAPLRRRFQKSILPEGISFKRGEGFGTAKLGVLYAISRDSGGSKTQLVRLVRANWNRLLDDLRVFSQANEEMRTGESANFDLDCDPHIEYREAA
jgi:hypothetical protein